MNGDAASRPLRVAHVIYRLDTGGLENGLVNLINRLPADRYRHQVICLTDYTDFARRIAREDVELVALRKRPGHDWRTYRALYRHFRRWRPDIVHSRNLAALEAQLPAWLAGVPARVHGEHGRDMSDPDGSNRKYILQRRLLRSFVQHYVALSGELETYLEQRIGVPSARISRILNGVDIERFAPERDRGMLPPGFAGEDDLVIGTVGRLDPVKGQATLVRAFIELAARLPEQGDRLRLVLVGDGADRAGLEAMLQGSPLKEQVWFAGSRDDIPACLATMDIFVLPSLAEGISNTIMEAMASGLPVVATAVGGNPELVQAGETGELVPREDPAAMAEALAGLVRDPSRRRAQGTAGRRRAETQFSLQAMVDRYDAVYQRVVDGAAGRIRKEGMA